MRIFSWNQICNENNASFFKNGSAVTIGSFDGPHKGHETLFQETLKAAEEKSLVSGIITFTQALPGIKHPVNYAGDISTVKQRLNQYEKLGFGFVILIDFDESFSHIRGNDFFNTLIQKCFLKFLCEGQDFRCGFKGQFGMNEITEFAFSSGFEVKFLKLVQEASRRVSSSHIRELIKSGNFTEAEKLLGRPYELEISDELRKNGGAFETSKGSLLLNRSRIAQVLPEEGVYKVRTDSGEECVLEIHRDFLFLAGFEADSVHSVLFGNLD